MHASNRLNSHRFLWKMSRRISCFLPCFSYGRCFLGFAPSFSWMNASLCIPDTGGFYTSLPEKGGVFFSTLIAEFTFNLLTNHHRGAGNRPCFID